MQATVIDLLSGKGKFSTEQSLVLAEAIDMAIEKAQLVTVPILDARLAGVNARTDRLEAIMSARFETIEARLAAMDAKMERWAIRLVLVMVVTQTALGPIGAGALDAVRRVLSTLIR